MVVITEPVPLLVQRHQKIPGEPAENAGFRRCHERREWRRTAALQKRSCEAVSQRNDWTSPAGNQSLPPASSRVSETLHRRAGLCGKAPSIPRFRGANSQNASRRLQPSLRRDQVIQRLAAKRTAVPIQHRQGIVGQAAVPCSCNSSSCRDSAGARCQSGAGDW